MSNVRLVRCPKCDKVLPEPDDVPVYKCGGCGTVLKAKKKSSVSDGLLDGSVGTLVKFGGDFDKEGYVSEEGSVSMTSRSPSRSGIGGSKGSRSPFRERDLTEFNGGLPKSPMRDRFLDDLGRTPGGSRNVSPSATRERAGSNDFDFNGVGEAPVRTRNVSRSPVRGRGETRVSVRTRDATRSPTREGLRASDSNGVDKSPARSMVGDMAKSPLRGGLGPEVERTLEEEQERIEKMTSKSSFNTWLSDEKHAAQLVDSYPGIRQRRMWREGVEDGSDQFSEGRESVYSDEHVFTSDGLADDLFHGIGHQKEKVYRDERIRGEYTGGNTRPRMTGDQRTSEGYGFRSSYGTSRVGIEKERYLASSSVVDSHSSYRPDPVHGYGGFGGQRHSFESSRGPSSAQSLQLEHAELLRKYRELKGQLNGLDGGGVSSSGFQVRSDDWSDDGSLRFEHGSVRQFSPGRNVPRPSQFSRIPGPIHNMADLHPFYDDQLAGQLRRPHPNNPHLSDYPMSRHAQVRSLDFDQDPLESYANYPHVHHPSCGCSLCYTSDWKARDSQSSLASRKHGNVAPNSTSSNSMIRDRHGSRAYDPRMAHTAPRRQQPHIGRQPHHHPVRAEVPSLTKRLCRPVSGGSPFVLCNKCFQLLKLPGKFIGKHRDQHQLQCGACSAVMSFDLQKISADQLPVVNKPDPAGTVSGYSEVMNDGPKLHLDSFATSSTTIGSYDFDAVGYTFQSMDSEDDKASKGQRFSSNLAELSRASGSISHSSKDERVSDAASVRSSQSNSSEMQAIASALNPRDDKQELENNNFSECPPEADASETEILSNEVPATSQSQDSWDIPGETPVPGNNKDEQSPIAAFFKGLSRSGRRSPGKDEVFVNGQAISHRLVKKAEKLAGPIKPGKYWYDPKAGFWGVMGHRCLGIIPPFIQEFSLPIPENCSGGDTTVYVNGRELHKKDLDLLNGRGLPTTRNKKYVIDISGEVRDEDTRNVVANLGRLAPSVERNKCGFGMQVPNQLDD